MNESLIEYIRKHLEYGTDIDKVKKTLLDAGHDIGIVEQHINHVLKHRKLKWFIKKHVKIGTDIDRLKQYLLNAGYDINIVEEHINDALKAKKNKKYILISVVLILVVLVASFGIYYYTINFKKTTQIVINETKEAEIKYQKNLEILNKAIIANDSSACQSIDENMLKTECQKKFTYNISNATSEECGEECMSKEILNQALINHNASLCAEIISDDTRKICEQSLKD